MRPALPILFTLAIVGGCTSIPSRCYVTLDNGGGPTAEACETGPELIVRPITPTNAAYYVPPYVIAALSYEGFLVPREPAVDADTDVDADGEPAGPDAAATPAWPLPAAGQTPWRQTVTGTEGLAIAFADDEDGVTADDLERFWDAGLMVTPTRTAPPVGAPENRLPQAYTIDGEIRYRRPDAFHGMSFPISSALSP
ncbi:hypothetical protein [Aurantimonas manganoxydans]|nr:hypothetical protein [Aurantimonas manganoxydans]